MLLGLIGGAAASTLTKNSINGKSSIKRRLHPAVSDALVQPAVTFEHRSWVKHGRREPGCAGAREGAMSHNETK